MREVDIALRFVEERERLGYSQSAFARLLGYSRSGVRNIEVAHSMMRAGALCGASRLGMDVQYVITGVRSENVDEVVAAIGYATLGERFAASVS